MPVNTNSEWYNLKLNALDNQMDYISDKQSVGFLKVCSQLYIKDGMLTIKKKWCIEQVQCLPKYRRKHGEKSMIAPKRHVLT